MAVRAAVGLAVAAAVRACAEETKAWAFFGPEETRTSLSLIPANPEPLNNATRTTYFCVFYELPADRDYHIVGWEAVVPPETESTLHHSIALTCATRDGNDKGGARIGGRFVTDGMRVPCEPMPPSACDTMFGGWTPGGWGNGPNGAFRTPHDAGFRVGPERRFAVVQYHHDNAALTPGLTSQAGFRVMLTPDLRPEDVGEVQLGPIAIGFAVPPERRVPDGLVDVVHTCTWNAAPTSAWAFRSHAHSHCVRQYSLVRRADGALLYLGDTNPFEYHSQPLVPLDPPTPIGVGDTLETHCLYKPDADRWVAGGLSTSDEMCIRHVLLAPAVRRPSWQGPFCVGSVRQSVGWSAGARADLAAAAAEYGARVEHGL